MIYLRYISINSLKVKKAIHKLVAKFSRSVAPKIQLYEMVGLAIVLNCPTRWWTDLSMMDRIQTIVNIQKEALNTIIVSRKWDKVDKDRDKEKVCRKLTDSDYELVSLFVSFFTYMKEKSDQLSGEQTCSIHLVHSAVKEILNHVSKWTDHRIIGSFATEFKTEFHHYFDHMIDPSNGKFEPIYIVTAFLSPFHQKFLTEDEKKLAVDYLKLEVSAFEHADGDILSEDSTAVPSITTPTPTPDISLPGLDLLKDLVGSGQVPSDNAEYVTNLEARMLSDLGILKKDADAVIQRYLRTGKIDDNQDILKYWDRMSYLCDSKLPEVACNLLVTPPSSVPSERLFSIAGLMSGGEFIKNVYIL